MLLVAVTLAAQQKKTSRAKATAKPAGEAAVEFPIVSIAIEGSKLYSEEKLLKIAGLKIGQAGDKAVFERSAADLTEEQRRDFAAAFQDAAIDTLIRKVERAIEQLEAQGKRPRSLLIGGGVSANSLLRKRALELGAARSLEVRLPAMSLCLDNAAMIAGLAHEYFTRGQFSDLGLAAISTSR